MVKALDARGKRKRAVDFFSDDTAAPGVPTPGGQRERHTPLWRMQTGLSNPPKGDSNARVGVTYVTDVLEKAYQAAEALSSKTTVFQSTDGDIASSPLSRDASIDFDTDGRDPPDRAPLESVVESENRLMKEETIDDTGGLSISSISSKTRNSRERQMVQEIGQDPVEPTMRGEPVPQEKPGPAPQDEARDERRGGNDGGHGARGVEAEGLIWFDESQATAYSVRYSPHGELCLEDCCCRVLVLELDLVMCTISLLCTGLHDDAGLTQPFGRIIVQARLPNQCTRSSGFDVRAGIRTYFESSTRRCQG